MLKYLKIALLSATFIACASTTATIDLAKVDQELKSNP